MKMTLLRSSLSIATLMAGTLLLAAPSAQAADEEAAKALARENKCLTCHGISKDKDGPSFKKSAEKYKGKADAEAALSKHLTSGAKIKLPDGTEEAHKIVKADPAQLKNLVQWILAQ